MADASAVLAIWRDEPERQVMAMRFANSARTVMSAVNACEVLARAHALRGAEGRREAEALLSTLGIEIVPADAARARRAADAYERFGKRMPAGLNLGDCFAYALAEELDAPLLYKGEDFGRTDVRSALTD